jgi:sortase A
VSEQPPPHGRGGPWPERPADGPRHAADPGPRSTPQPSPQARHGRRETVPDQPPQFIPTIDETAYIPKVEDFGAVSQGRSNYPDGDAGERTEEHHFGATAFTRPVAAPPPRRKDTARTVVRTFGEVLITLGMVVLLFVVYELYVTNIFAARKQASATTSLNSEWDTVGGPQRTNHYDLTDGHGIAKIYIPAFGQDYVFTIVEGTSQADLAIGPGHYSGSALPGQPGNMAVAGHRVSEGAPFDQLGILQSCDAIVIETDADWFVYRLLPMRGEVSGWAAGRGTTAQCSGPNGEAPVRPLGGLYAQTVGQEIVLPTQGDVVAPIPHHFGAQVSAGQMVSLLTLTTCNPKFSAAQRMILHAVLVKDWKKNSASPTMLPPEMKETS